MEWGGGQIAEKVLGLIVRRIAWMRAFAARVTGIPGAYWVIDHNHKYNCMDLKVDSRLNI